MRPRKETLLTLTFTFLTLTLTFWKDSGHLSHKRLWSGVVRRWRTKRVVLMSRNSASGWINECVFVLIVTDGNDLITVINNVITLCYKRLIEVVDYLWILASETLTDSFSEERRSHSSWLVAWELNLNVDETRKRGNRVKLSAALCVKSESLSACLWLEVCGKSGPWTSQQVSLLLLVSLCCFPLQRAYLKAHIWGAAAAADASFLCNL